MLSYRELTAVTVAALLLVSGMVAGVALTGTAVAATELTQCTTIDEPGEYVLANNITNESATSCIEIFAENVTIDGNGYTIDGVDGNGVGIAEADIGLRVVDVTVTGFGTGIELQTGRVEDSSLVENGVGVSVSTSNGTIINSSLSSNTQNGLRSSVAGTVVLRHSRVVGNGEDGVSVFRTERFDAPGLVAADNLIADNGGTGLTLRESNSSLSNNTIRANADAGVLTSLGPTRFSGDRIVHNGEEGIVANSDIELTGVTVGNNTDTGVHVIGTDQFGNKSATILDSAITSNGDDGVVVDERADATIHDSVLADNAGLGVNATTTTIVNATDNYWGASDGPGSAEDSDAPFADPVTGELANGSGDGVSENPTDNGTSNVHFDPFLTENPVGDNGADTPATTEISSCTVIDEPGAYELTTNITNATASLCIAISAENVTFDGNNHTISGVDENGTAIDTIGAGLPDPRITHVTVRGWNTGIDPGDGVIRDSVVTENGNGIHVDGARARVVDNRITDNTVGIEARLSGGTDVGPLVRDNLITDNVDSGVQAYRSDLHLTNNTVTDNGDDGVTAEQSDIVSTNNTIRENDGVGLAVSMGRLDSTDDVIEANAREGIAVYGQADITGTTVRDNDGDGIAITGDANAPSGYGNATITDTSVVENNGTGIVGDTSGALTIEDSIIRANSDDGIRASDGNADDEVVAVTVHGSVIAANGGLGVNAGALVANATGNYWGASDGPSSASDPDAPFADPVTGAPADGSGDEVSEHPTDNGTSNVHFDPFLAGNPTTDDGAEDRTAYQIDLAAGEVIEDLGADEDAFYGRQDRLLQAMSVLADGTVTDTFRVPDGEVTRALDGCTVTYDAVAFDDADGTATLRVSVEDCEDGITLTLAAYELPDGTVEFQRNVADRQELVAYETVTLEEGDTTVSIPVHESDE